MDKFKIIASKGYFKVQERKLFLFWKTIQQTKKTDSQDVDEYLSFPSWESAQSFIQKILFKPYQGVKK